ncbi:MAG: hypothetical protein LQ340_000391 [Diploschistes diacapsis]|nr:MAG: hypothetical protein LQ340_000391 [Diploschistes diacapsis]
MLRQYVGTKDGSDTGPGALTKKALFMPPERLGHQSPAARSIGFPRPPASRPAEDSHSKWTADFLKDLRHNRPARPGGARPLPARNERSKDPKAALMPERAASAFGMREAFEQLKEDMPERSASALSNIREKPTMGPRELPGRPVARLLPTREVSSRTTRATGSRDTQPAATPQYKIPYYERGQRWMEKQEMSSLRQALEDKDVQEEGKIHAAAQEEASELVWKHQNSGAPYSNPDRPSYKEHLRKGSHARSQSVGPFESLYIPKKGSDSARSASDGSNSNKSGRSVSKGSQQSNNSSSSNGSRGKRSSTLSFSMRSRRLFLRKGSGSTRNVSRGSGATVVNNTVNLIYEEPEHITVTAQDQMEPLALKPKARNTSYGSREVKEKIDKLNRTQKTLEETQKRVSIVDIHKNAPSQSRNGHYSRNADLPSTPESIQVVEESDKTRSRDGKEIRGDDIRAATSMRLKDRSPKLPSPSVVSDKPNRPIVSFNKDWKPREKELKHEVSSSTPVVRTEYHDQKPPILQHIFSAPAVPTINFPDEPASTGRLPAVPSISISESPSISIGFEVPSISVSPEAPQISVSSTTPTMNFPPGNSSSRPLPQPVKRPHPSGRPLPTHAATAPVKSAPHWSPARSRSQAQCAACALPISGRIVSAASERFHPQCFTCFQCGELLECVAFYPEPEKHRSERLARLQARVNGEPIPTDQAHHTEMDDGDDSLRFYCHLDFHEKYSPRCRSCKTPIEGEIILACGGEWHVGHFFCAECGDPFQKDVPFVEKDGFAWCVGCHTKRYSGKCAGCKRPVTDVVVNALGREWHEGCFCCTVSLAPFSERNGVQGLAAWEANCVFV